jgi:large subunit ribosomal protein L13Ae
MFEKQIVVDGKNHMAGRLAAAVAKELLNGQKVVNLLYNFLKVVVRCEKLNISGSLYRNQLKFLAWLDKKHLTNPKRGPFHRRSPVGMFTRMVRGMLKYKTARGEAALKRLECFEGIPEKFHTTKRRYVYSAYRNLRIKPMRDFCVMGDLAKAVGWVYSEAVEKCETERKNSSKMFYKLKVLKTNLMKKAKANVLSKDTKIQKINNELAQYGY